MSGSAAIADLIFNVIAVLFMLEFSRVFLQWAKEDCKK
jgi:hypothetical protein